MGDDGQDESGDRLVPFLCDPLETPGSGMGGPA